MARFDWFAFLRQHNIPYTTTGPNASRGRVNIKCPFCSDDPSQHLGISINGHGWSCWRNKEHVSKSNPRLIARLINCSLDEAETMIGDDLALVPSTNDVSRSLRELVRGPYDAPALPTTLSLLKEFKPLSKSTSPFAAPYQNYLRDRGYRANQLVWLTERYDLHYATTGRFAGRIIIPIYDRYHRLQTWTGRSIRVDAELRYKTLKKDEQLCSPKQTLLGLPLLSTCAHPKLLIVCEGPFDAFWLTAFGRSFGVYATCLFGLTMSGQQAELLSNLRSRFPRMSVLLDSTASFQAFRMAHSGLQLDVIRLPEHVKDPAELLPQEVMDICLSKI